ncbi:MAG: hypothetical protein NW206_10945 [Hyphomonadaceae bacterium]|nr:hypothetical protein [Hyphomonadaceae bacterium]
MKADAGHMRLYETRALTQGEIAFAMKLFGDELDWPRLRVMQAPRLGFGAMVPLGKTIVFSRWPAARDFSMSSADEQGWFVHELMHVWQAAHGVPLALAKLGALGAKAYRYVAKPQAKFGHYNIERQAEIARHLYLARIGHPEKGAPARDWLEAVWATR